VITLALWVIVFAVAVNDVSGVVAPTAPDKVIVFVPAFSVKSWAPSTVPPNEIAPLFALVFRMLETVNVDGDAVETSNECAVIFPPIFTALAVVLAFAIVIDPSTVVPPTMPPKVMAPELPPFKVKSVVPFSVEEKLIDAPAEDPLVVSNARGVTVNETGPVIPIAPLLVVRFPPIPIIVEPV
jgi:hypothetical protein